MRSFTEALADNLLTEEIDKAAAKQFNDSIRDKFIDIDAFHKAYDSELSALGMTDIFINNPGAGDHGLLKSRGTYGAVKNCTNLDVQRALKKLWVAQFSDYLHTKAQEAERAAQEAEYKRKQAEEAARREAEKQAEIAKLKPTVDAAVTAALNKIKADYPDLAADFREVSGKDMADDLDIEYKLGWRQNGEIGGKVEIGFTPTNDEGRKPIHIIDPYKPIDTNDVARVLRIVAERTVDIYIDNKLGTDYADLLTKFGLKPDDFSSLYLLDSTTNNIYDYYMKSDRFKLHMYYNHKDRNPASHIKFKDLPKIDNLRLIVADLILKSSSSNCYHSFTKLKYYDPTVKKFFLVKCEVAFVDTPGSNGRLEAKPLPDLEVPEKFKALGLTKAEWQHYEIDSSD